MKKKRSSIETLDFEKPAPGKTTRVSPSVQWLRMPLPFALDHINLWLIDEGEQLCLVDSGLRGEKTQGLWQEILTQQNSKPSRLVVTHMHPDHVGSAGWLCEHYDLDLHMTRGEYLMCRVLAADAAPPPPEATRHFRGAGFDEEQLADYAAVYGGFGKACGPLPPSFVRLQDGEKLIIGDTPWTLIMGNGHSPEHACLFQPEENVVISGDQLLPGISSNVSVWPTEPGANPLKDWLTSCRKLLDCLPEDVTVLPSHGRPFRGAHNRLRDLIAEHEESLEQLLALCTKPIRALDTFEILFRAPIGKTNRTMATGEAIAHLNYLMAEGLIERQT
ncbi:MAG: MBL fold metallo-hydrolase, partial [Pseudomonadota bacterium]